MKKIAFIRTGALSIGILLMVLCPTGRDVLKNPVDYVNPFIGTAGHGHTYPGVSLPFGMVQLSPDTRLTGWDGCSGYHYSDHIITGFSHTHLSGTGVSDYGDILLMPRTGEVRLQNGYPDDPGAGYGSRFRHKKESASPGLYSVFLDDYQVDVALTASLRTGFHKYIFPEGSDSHILIDLTHRDPVIDSYIRIVNDSEVEGYRCSRAWAEDQRVYFVARFSKPFESCHIAIHDTLNPQIKEARTKHLKAVVSFTTDEDETLFVKVGLSAVDMQGARKNLDAEIPHWDFDRICHEADSIWNRELSRIEVEGGSETQKTIFYTALYHTLLNPNLFMDVDGRFRGTDGKIHHAADFTNYTVFSLWDTFRAAHPLFTIIQQDRTRDFIRTFLAHYEHGGRLPIWELAGNYTGCMIGYHAIPVIVDAYLKGIRGYDAGTAMEAMKHSADQDHLGLGAYKTYGYIPLDEEPESVSKTLEYAYDDWCIAQMARSLGKEDDFQRFIQRAQFYKNTYDPFTGFMRPRMNGAWQTPFDPREVTFSYTEANAWQYSFFVPQDVSGLMDLMGGREHFIEKLDALFSAGTETTGRDQADITGLIGQYAHGNEPSHHMAYLYNHAGQPWKTQKRVREILDTMYHAAPDGLIGNEDCGQMSAWYVLSALGFYPVTPGQTAYSIGTPLFRKAVIHLENGNRFTILADSPSSRKCYIRSVCLNGKPYSRAFLNHSDIWNGGELIFHMGSRPDAVLGAGPGDSPVSKIVDNLIQPVPFITAESRTFTDSLVIGLQSVTENTAIYYTLDGSDPTHASPSYTGPIVLNASGIVRAMAMRGDGTFSKPIRARFYKIPKGRSIHIQTQYSSQYTAGGDQGLIDTIRGGENFRNGAWQGYQGTDFEAVIDLGRVQSIVRISAGFLQDIGSWIWMPVSVEYAVSLDGSAFQPVAKIKTDVLDDVYGAVIRDFETALTDIHARYVRVRAKNYGVLPEWHSGAGGKAWIFIDEIIVE